MKTVTLQKLIYWTLGAMMLLPLVTWSASLSPFHVAKVLLFRIGVEILLILWVWLLLKDAQFRPRWTPLTIAVTTVASSFVLSTIVAADSLYALWGTVERMGGLFTFLHYYVFYLVLVSVVQTREQWERLLKITVWVGVVAGLYGLAQWFDIRSILGIDIVGWQRDDPVGTAGNAAMFAGYLLFPIFLSIYFALRFLESSEDDARNQKRTSIPYLTAGVFMMVIVLLTATRAPLGGLFIGAMVAAGLFALKWRKTGAFSSRNSNDSVPGTVAPVYRMLAVRKVALVIFIVGLLAIVGAFALRDIPFIDRVPGLQYVNTITPDNATFQTRLWTWRSVWGGIKERPLFGWGPDNIFVPFNRDFNPLHFRGFGSETWFDRAHNLFFDETTTRGAVGFVATSVLFITLLYTLWRPKSSRFSELSKNDAGNQWLGAERHIFFGALFTGLVVAYLVHLSMLFDVFVTYFVFFLFVAWIDSRSRTADAPIPGINKKGFPESKASALGYRNAIVVAVIAVVTWGLWTNIRIARADYITTRALLATRVNLDAATVLFDRAIGYNAAPTRMEARLKLAQFTLEVQETGRLRDKKTIVGEEDKEKLLRFTEEHLREGVELHPLDAQHVIFLGRIRNSIAGLYEPELQDEAIVILEHGVELSPTRQRMVFELAQALVIAKRNEEALELLNKTVEANPRVAVAYWYRGIVRGQIDDVDGALTDVRHAQELGYDPERDYRDMLRLVNINLAAENLERVAELYEAVVAKVPDNPQYWASLAATYKELGRYDDARRAAITAADIAPAFAPQVQQFLQTLPR